MKKVLNNLSAMLIKSFYEVLRISLLMLAFITIVFLDIEGAYKIEKIILISYLNYIISAGLTFIIGKKDKGVLAPEKIIPIVAIMTVLVSIFVFMKSFPVPYKMAALIALPMLWKRGSNYRIHKDGIEQTKRAFLISTVVLFIYLYLLFTLNSHVLYSDIINVYFPLYIIVSLLHTNMINLSTAYEESYSNSINQDENISKFNLISILVSIILMGLVLTRFFGLWESNFFLNSLKSIRDGFAEVLVIVSYPFARVMYFIIFRFRKWIQQFNSVDDNEENNVEGEVDEVTDDEFIDEEFVDDYVMDEGLAKAFTYISWILMAAIGLFIMYKLYKYLKKGLLDDKNKIGNEEREFVLSFNDILEGFKKPFRNLFEGMTKSLNKNYFKELHEVRKTYILMVKRLINLGFNRKSFHTPNEYLSSVKGQGYDKSEFTTLTKLYNKVRYGKKELSDVELDNVLEIKSKIDSMD